MKTLIRLLSAALLLMSTAMHAHAQTTAQSTNYPSHPIKMIVPIAPGGPSDVAGRLIADRLGKNLGQAVIIENEPGAGGNVGMGRAVHAAPDGYTLLIVSSSYVVNPSLYAKVPYDPDKDFTPVTLVATSPNIMVINPSVAAKSMGELIDMIKANPGTFSFAHSGIGTTPDLSGELFKQSHGLDLVAVPYNGSAPAIQSAIAGHTQIAFLAVTPAIAQVKAGKVRAMAVTTAHRSSALPDVPTLGELGIRDQEADTFTGIMVPAGTPQAIVDALQREVVKVLSLPDVRQQLVALGFEPIGSTPAEFATRIKNEIPRWRNVIRTAGLKAE